MALRRPVSTPRRAPASSLAAAKEPWQLQPLSRQLRAPLGTHPPSPQTALGRLQAVRPAEYARTRNHLDGAVTGLSPYITHGMLPFAQVIHTLRDRHGLGLRHKLIQELAWRAYFRHRWRHDGERIFGSLHAGPLPDSAYASLLPSDVLEGRTGVPAIDQAVRVLYTTGTLHNHARLWLASYLIHVRKVHWRIGADWMWAHLLDGDLASNHLSWQWVAGTASAKPYLFNAENVSRFAPAPWHSPATAIDATYTELEHLARAAQALKAEPGAHPGVLPPPVRSVPPQDFEFSAPDAAAIVDREIWLMHPWSLARPPDGALCIAFIDLEFHTRWPWSVHRWAWVLAHMGERAQLRWAGSTQACVQALGRARAIHGPSDPHLPHPIGAMLSSPAPAFAEPVERCRSFSHWWQQVNDFGAAVPPSAPLQAHSPPLR